MNAKGFVVPPGGGSVLSMGPAARPRPSCWAATLATASCCSRKARRPAPRRYSTYSKRDEMPQSKKRQGVRVRWPTTCDAIADEVIADEVIE